MTKFELVNMFGEFELLGEMSTEDYQRDMENFDYVEQSYIFNETHFTLEWEWEYGDLDELSEMTVNFVKEAGAEHILKKLGKLAESML